MSDGCPKCAEKMARIKKLESALRELVRVNETSAGDDEREWAAAMLAAHEALREDETMNGTTLISIERSRHASKGFDAAHDRTHSNSDMAKAAMCYIDEAIYDLHNRDGCVDCGEFSRGCASEGGGGMSGKKSTTTEGGDPREEEVDEMLEGLRGLEMCSICIEALIAIAVGVAVYMSIRVASGG